jgi:hypothetical protein
MPFGTEMLTPCVNTLRQLNIIINIFYEIKILNFKFASQY